MVTEIQQGLPVKQDYRLHRVAGDIQQGYWFRELPAPECCRFRSVTGSRVLSVLEYCRLQRNLLYPSLRQETSFKSSADNRFAGYRELPVPECCWFRNRSAAGNKEICSSHPYWQGTSFKSSADNRFNS